MIQDTTQIRRDDVTFPLIKKFYYTGEDLNPWRCECCITTKQLKKIDKMKQAPADTPAPACCRKCGVQF